MAVYADAKLQWRGRVLRNLEVSARLPLAPAFISQRQYFGNHGTVCNFGESARCEYLVDDPKEMLAQQAYDRKTSQIRGACERDKEAVFRKFTRERRQLTKRRLKKRTKK